MWGRFINGNFVANFTGNTLLLQAYWMQFSWNFLARGLIIVQPAGSLSTTFLLHLGSGCIQDKTSVGKINENTLGNY